VSGMEALLHPRLVNQGRGLEGVDGGLARVGPIARGVPDRSAQQLVQPTNA